MKSISKGKKKAMKKQERMKEKRLGTVAIDYPVFRFGRGWAGTTLYGVTEMV